MKQKLIFPYSCSQYDGYANLSAWVLTRDPYPTLETIGNVQFYYFEKKNLLFFLTFFYFILFFGFFFFTLFDFFEFLNLCRFFSIL